MTTPFDAVQGISRADAIRAVGPGWTRLVHRAYDAIEADAVQVAQVKEKFGALRIYLAAHPIAWSLRRRLMAVERLSLHTCEVCARRGSLRDDPVAGERWVWFKTLCEYHAWCRARVPRAGWFPALVDVARDVEQHAPPAVGSFLDVVARSDREIPPELMRDLLRLAQVGSTGDATAPRWIEYATFALERATPNALALCTPLDLEPLLLSDDTRARTAALLAVAHVRAQSCHD